MYALIVLPTQCPCVSPFLSHFVTGMGQSDYNSESERPHQPYRGGRGGYRGGRGGYRSDQGGDIHPEDGEGDGGYDQGMC